VAALDTFTEVASGTIRWGGALATEIVLLPATIRSLREVVVTLGTLPAEIERLNVALGEATGTLEEHVPMLSRVVTEDLARTVDDLGGRVGGLLDVVDHALPSITRLLDTLPDQLERLDGIVTGVGDQLGVVLPRLQEVVIDELQERVQHLDEVVTELSATLTSVLGAIPGVRRSVRST
jgi:ABC-type transporter Mla subunit MlaD